MINANWKLLAENSIDAFHGFPVHSTYFDYLKNIGSLRMDSGNSEFTARGMTNLGNGHAVIEYASPWGRPVARWVPSWGEDKKELVEHLRAGLIQRFGPERGTRIAETSRNMLIFPNLVINDIMAITVRTFFPDAHNRMTVSAWALGARDEDAELRKLRLFNFLEFLGPGGFATPDDQEALENCQRGYRNLREVGWNDISKGMPRNGPPMNDDEEQMRCFWRQWRDRMASAAGAL
jgi:p-cumate 2,3-dioxygenase alpha subunit